MAFFNRKKKSKSAKGAKGARTKDSARKSAVSDEEQPNLFWRQAAAVLLFLLAVLLLFGGFGSGGPLPVGMFDGTRRTIGVIAFAAPLLLVLAAITKIRSPDHQLPKQLFWGFIVFLITATGFAHLFVSEKSSLQAVEDGLGGGYVGHLTDSAILSFLNKTTGGIVLFVVALIAMHFIFSIKFNYLFKWLRLTKRDKTSASDDLQTAEGRDGYAINEGVALRRSETESSGGGSAEQVGVLTTTRDSEWHYPGIELLDTIQDSKDPGDIVARKEIIHNVLSGFGFDVEMKEHFVGPRLTQYTILPPSNMNVNKLPSLENNLAMELAATSVRIQAPIPGKKAVGIEVPNEKPATVRLHEILTSPAWTSNRDPLAFAVGRDITGQPVVGTLENLPHLMIAGATNSGKSVMINTLLASLLFRNSPADLKLILIDPKEGVELAPYNDIPHLLTPVVTDATQCVSAFKWTIAEMQRRYVYLHESEKRNIGEYNKLKQESGMPYIVVIVDELADIMMTAGRDIETLIARLAQKARAVGIHLVLATQRPSRDVIFGHIQSNVLGRIAFTVSKQVDSRIILDEGGAEKLLGAGDMLFKTPDSSITRRIQGAMVSDAEIERITTVVKAQRSPDYDNEVISQKVHRAGDGRGAGSYEDYGDGKDDELLEEATQIFVDSGRASTALLQRRLRIGYGRAARIMDILEDQGVIGPPDGARPRQVLISHASDYMVDNQTPQIPIRSDEDAEDESLSDEQP